MSKCKVGVYALVCMNLPLDVDDSALLTMLEEGTVSLEG